VTTQILADLDRPATTDYGTIADEDRVQRAAAALERNGMDVFRAADAGEARRIVLSLIPEGADVYHGASLTLEATGITEAIEQSDRYEALRPRIRTMDRETEATQLRQLSAAPDLMLGSVHAVTEDGSLITASMGGGQLGPYVSGAGRVILVVGTQKIVTDLADGLRRVYEHALPLEDARAQAAYGIHSAVNKLLIINREIMPGRITVVLVDEALGF
jgi:CBS domain-containing protein